MSNQPAPYNQPCVVRLKEGDYAIARLLPALFFLSRLPVPEDRKDGKQVPGEELIWAVEDQIGFNHRDAFGNRWEVEEVIMVLPKSKRHEQG